LIIEEAAPTSASRPTATLSVIFDNATKVLAILVAVIYAVGYLVWSIYESHYGLELNAALTPRTGATGMLALALTAFPIATCRAFQKYLRSQTTEFGETSLAFFSGSFHVIASSMLICGASEIMAPPIKSNYFFLYSMVLLIIFGGAEGGKAFLSRRGKLHGIVALCVYFGLCSWLCYSMARAGYHLRSAYWVYSVLSCAIFFGVKKIRTLLKRDDGLFRYNQAIFLIACLVLAVVIPPLVFADCVLPNIQRAWGGGLISTVTVKLSGQAFIYPSLSHKFGLLDETDQGYYLVDYDKRVTLFIPRDQVEGLVF
jgi:hypothetical protein